MQQVATVAGLLVIAAAVAAILRGHDVRLVMLAAAFALGGLAGDPTVVVHEFFNTLAAEKFVVPICSAMGFAFVLKTSGCDRHLVLLLTRPVRRFRGVLIPAAVAVGFVVNIAMVSQASTAIAVGTVLIPLMRSAGLSPAVIGSALLLGASIGGELLNPGAPEFASIRKVLSQEDFGYRGRQLVMQPVVAPLLFVQLTVAGLAFWWWVGREPRESADTPPSLEPVNYFKAVVPLVPLAALMAVGPPLHWLHIPEDWLVMGGGEYGSRLIGVAMLFGSLLAVVATPSVIPQVAKSFFEGAGYALSNIISIIVTANCFGAGVKALDLARGIGPLTKERPGMIWLLAAAGSMTFAIVCGSGIAATASLYGFFAQTGADADHNLAIGAMTSIASAAGRTASPAAAVVLLCASLVEVRPADLLRRVMPPLVLATAVTALVAAIIYR